MNPRVVVIYRQTQEQYLRRSYGSLNNAAYALEMRSNVGSFSSARSTTALAETAFDRVYQAIPDSWRRAKVIREDLDRFNFEPGDIVAVVGQDGLVANVSKYLRDEQVVVGFNDNPDRNPGALVPFMANNYHQNIRELLERAAEKHNLQKRTMVRATLDDGQTLTCLNEIFVGHAGHQSARYLLNYRGQMEAQSSSGVLVCTGTGATGWCKSVMLENKTALRAPTPETQSLVYFVREAWPSPGTGVNLVEGEVSANEQLVISSEIEENGVIFGDGIEVDHLNFAYGRIANIGVAEQKLHMLTLGA
ncbi:MAG TPA: hypothetical protein VJ742_13295 [Nitrososphaera sp.]|nr:hypothetical protein [Nitrososphaera sp.]